MAVTWQELRPILSELVIREPCPLQGYPDPRAVHQHLPARIRLRPWALAVAERLHARFGDEVILTVGALSFPGEDGEVEATRVRSSEPLLDPTDVEVIAPEALVVRSGKDLRIELQVTNHRSSPISISTGPSAFGAVLDPSTGEVVGGYSGAAALVHRVHRIDPGATGALPLVVGTASYKRSLGYAVPPGEWLVEVLLRLGEGERRVPFFPLRIIEWDTGEPTLALTL